MCPVTILKKLYGAWLNIFFLWETKVGHNKKTGPFPGQKCNLETKYHLQLRLHVLFFVLLN